MTSDENIDSEMEQNAGLDAPEFIFDIYYLHNDYE